MMFHFNSFASMLSAVTMAATSAPTHASESRHLIHDAKNDGGPMDATGDRNPFIPSKIAESYNPQLDADKNDMVLLLHPRPIFPGKEQKGQAGTLRNEDASNTPKTTSDGKSKRIQTADTSAPFDPSLDFGILDRNWATPNGRELDDLGCNAGNNSVIPAEVDFADLIDECLDDPSSCPYNLPIKCWNVSLVTDMFEGFTLQDFNEDISAWDVSSVTSMERMFEKAYYFNQPVDSWDVSSVTNMYTMFAFATYFNQPVDSWDVSSVTNMYTMFAFANDFNQPIDSWDVSSVKNMDRMFYFAYDFNQCLSTWADKVPFGVTTNFMFQFSNCPNIPKKFPDPNGPWCQYADICIVPTESPTQTENPTESPTENLTKNPTDSPTENPTESPTENPTDSPTENPTESPTENPTDSPTVNPTENPTDSPTENPTAGPTPVPVDCTDNPTKTFVIDLDGKTKKDGDCAWLASKKKSKRKEYCGMKVEVNGNSKKLSAICKETCGLVGFGQCTPEPTSAPTSSPISKPDNDCEDKSKEFEIDVDGTGTIKTKDCDWVASKKKSRQREYCKMKVEINGNKKKLQKICIETCGKLGKGECAFLKDL